MAILNINSVNNPDFIPEILLQNALGYIRNRLKLVNTIAKDSDIGAVATKGQVLTIAKRGTLTAQQRTETGAIVLQQPDSAKVQVTVDQEWHVAFALSDILAACGQDGVAEGYVADALAVLAEKVEATILAKYASMTHQLGTATTDIDESLILSIRQHMNEHNAPQEGRVLSVSPKDETAILKIDRFTRADAIGNGTALSAGALGRCHGFEIFAHNLTPVVAGPIYHNVAYTKTGLVLVSRPLPDIVGAVSTKIQDPETGLIMRLTSGYNADYNTTQVVLDMLWGTNIMRDEFVVDVLS